MKSSFRLLSVVILLITLFIGCKKNQTTENPRDKSNPIDLQKIESLVKYCANRVNSPLKTTDSIPVDSLQYYLEATSNYTYGIASAHGELQKIDSNFFKVPCFNNKIAMTDVNSVYTILIDSVRASFRRIQDQNKNLVVVTTSPATVQSNKALFKVTSIILYGNNYQVGLFDTIDFWNYGRGQNGYGGKCGPYSGQGNPYLDAAKMIQNRVMLRKGLSYGYYIGPYYNVPLSPTDYPNPNHTGSIEYFSFYLFINAPGYSDYHECIRPYEINWYLFGAEHICYTDNNVTNHGARPPNTDFINITLIGDLWIATGDILHYGTAYYGTYISGGLQSTL